MDREAKVVILQSLLNKLIFDDPRFRSFIRDQVRHFSETHPQDDADKETVRRLRIQNNKLLEQVACRREQLKLVKRQVLLAKANLKKVLRINKSLATALGSCDACWGDDKKCTFCSGKGKPGWRNKNHRLFNRYIAPALRAPGNRGT